MRYCMPCWRERRNRTENHSSKLEIRLIELVALAEFGRNSIFLDLSENPPARPLQFFEELFWRGKWEETLCNN